MAGESCALGRQKGCGGRTAAMLQAWKRTETKASEGCFGALKGWRQAARKRPNGAWKHVGGLTAARNDIRNGTVF